MLYFGLLLLAVGVIVLAYSPSLPLSAWPGGSSGGSSGGVTLTRSQAEVVGVVAAVAGLGLVVMSRTKKARR